MIACLGWGSLVWNPQNLPVRRSWFLDGPLLPLEFTRESRNMRVTIVLTRDAAKIRSLWALMSCGDLDSAKRALCERAVGASFDDRAEAGESAAALLFGRSSHYTWGYSS